MNSIPTCPIHKIDLVCFCPACRGAMKSKVKAAAARVNGKLGGRRKKDQKAANSVKVKLR